MSAICVKSVSAYLPLLRFDRAVARKELRWAGLGGNGRGHRAVAGWDEDALTLAVEAGRVALSQQEAQGLAPSGLTFASTSSPFIDRSVAGLATAALALPADCFTQDVAGSRRAATSALMRALRTDGSSAGDALILAGEKRSAMAGTAQIMSFGDGAGAVLTGPGEGVARLLGAATLNADLLDIQISAENGLPYEAENRFVRDEAVAGVYLPAIGAALAEAGISASDIAFAVVPEPVSGTYRALAKPLGLTAPNFCEAITGAAGDLGAALPLFGFALALDRATQGDRILIAGFGNGCDAMIFEVTGPGDGSATDALGQGAVLSSYSRFLSLTGALPLNWGPRAEVNQKVSASTLFRHGRDMHGFIGGRDAGGNVQFPKTPIPVRPGAEGPEPYEDVRLADVPAVVASITADRLNFTPDPPFYFGLVQFENGARVPMEHCDVADKTPEVGDKVRMRFRIKAMDRQRDQRSYFWKAAPVARPDLGGEA
ncbi:MAG: hypothetical protein ACRBCL_13405 [Maritimibacter sp.]